MQPTLTLNQLIRSVGSFDTTRKEIERQLGARIIEDGNEKHHQFKIRIQDDEIQIVMARSRNWTGAVINGRVYHRVEGRKARVAYWCAYAMAKGPSVDLAASLGLKHVSGPIGNSDV